MKQKEKQKIRKVAIYIRVSTEEQVKEGYSISAQRQRLKAYCIAQDWDVAGFYVDEGISAKNMQRPELQRMLQDIQSGLIDCVLVYKLDRLTRSVLDLYKMLEIFDEYNCKFKSATEVYDTTTAMGRMFITIVAALAQWERENTGERVSMGFHEKTRQGKFPLNFRPYGYDLDLNTGTLSINETEAEVVRTIFDLYIYKGLGGTKICKYLNERNITTRLGNTWVEKPLMTILKNKLYAGTFKYGSETLETPVIIPEEKYNMVQMLMKRKRELTNPKQAAGEHIFSGTMRCIICGHALTGYTGYRTLATGERVMYKYYRCLRKKTGQCIDSRGLSEMRLERSFLDYIKKLDFEVEAAMIAKKNINKINKNKNKDSSEVVSKELEKIKRRIKKWQYAWANETMSDEEYAERMEEERALEESLKAKVSEEDPTSPEINELVLKEILSNFQLNWDKLEKAEKRSLVQFAIKRVHFDFDEKGVVYVTGLDFF